MDNKQIFDIISNSTYAYRDLERHLRLLKLYLTVKLFNSDKELHKIIPDKADIDWINELPQELLAQFNAKNLSTIFDALEETVKNISPLIVYVSFEVDKNSKIKIGEWLRANLKTQVFYDLKYDPTLIGGCALVHNGIYKDFSIRANIQEKKETILENIRQSLNSLHTIGGQN